MATDLPDLLTTYLTDAHAIEEQALQQLKRAPDLAGEPAFARALQEHREETEGHERRMRALLEERDASPSKLKDVVMKAGGEAFVLFARSQTDTPGKLASHALSYEALEWASYDVLVRTAEAVGDTRVAEAAREIRAEERAMMERIEGILDRTAEASLADALTEDVEAHLRRYLQDAHAIEAQSIELLEKGEEMVEGTSLAQLFRDHRAESRRQQEALEARLAARGAEPSKLKDAALRIGALNWGMFFGAQPDTTAKLAAFAYAFEHLEIGGYEQLHYVAERLGDTETVTTVEGILTEERQAATRLAASFGEAVRASLAERVG